MITSDGIEIKTSLGTLKAYESPDPDYPGIIIMLKPEGKNWDGAEIDIAGVEVQEAANNPAGDGRIHITTWGDPSTEDYTHQEVFGQEELDEADKMLD